MRRLLFLLVLPCLLSLFAPGPQQSARAQLALNSIDRIAGSDQSAGGDTGQFCSSACDPFGGEHIVYYDATFKRLKYARRPQGMSNWAIDVLDSSGDAGRYTSLAFGPVGVTTTTLGTFTNGSNIAELPSFLLSRFIIGARVKRQSDSQWNLIEDYIGSYTVRLAAPYSGPSESWAICDVLYNMPAVAYQKTASNGGSSMNLLIPQYNYRFFSDQVDPQRGTAVQATDRKGYYASVDVSSSGTIHLAWQNRDYSSSPVGELRYATAQTTYSSQVTYAYATPDNTPGSGMNTRLKLEGNFSSPAILNRNPDTSDLRISRLSPFSGSWETYVLDADSTPGTALDLKYWPGQNRYVMAYQSSTATSSTQTVKSRTIDLSNGNFTPNQNADLVTSGTGIGSYVATAAGNGVNDLYQLFYDKTMSRLMYCRYNSSGTTFSQPGVLDGAVNPGAYVSAHINPVTGRLAAAYYDSAAQALKFAEYDGVTTPTTQYVDGIKAGSFSAMGQTSTEVVAAYRNDVDGSLHVARWPLSSHAHGAGFVDEAVDTTSINSALYISLAVDANDRIYVVYYDRFYNRLMEAIYNGSAWSRHQIALQATGNIGEFAHLAIDAAKSMLAVAYYDAAAQRPHVLTAPISGSMSGDPGTSWTAAVDSSAFTKNTGKHVALAFSGDGTTLNLAYFNENTMGLEFATVSGGSLTTETVEQGLFSAAGQYNALAINPITGSPMIAYYDLSNGALKFAEKSGAVWTKTTLDAETDTGRNPIILINQSRNELYAVYYNPTRGELRAMLRPLSGGAWLGPYTLATNYRGSRPSGMVMADGNLKLAFYDEAQGDLLTGDTATSLTVNAAKNGWRLYR